VLSSPALLRLTRAVALPVVVLAAAGGCKTSRPLAVRVSIPGPDSVETPVTGVGVVALPYDRDSVLRALEGRARTPRPPTAPIESLYAAFRGPFLAYSAAAVRLARLRDSAGGPVSADSLRQAQIEAERTRAALDRARQLFAGRGDTLRLRMRQWEDSTYQGYDSIVQGLARQSGREPVTDTTGADGWASLTVSPGRWWIYARSWDATDPNAEWYWNVPLPATGDTLLLSSRSARRQPRY
jgi:hypothetical protein